MADEATGYAGAAGIAFAHTVVDQLGDKEIVPSPPNYELWATYRTGAFPDLNREVEARLAAGEDLTPALCEDLYERFFMPTRSYEQLVQTGESIAHELVGALVHLREANTNAGAFASKLEDAASDMEATPDPSHIKALVRSLVAETREVAARNRRLEAQMEASSKQMEALQVSVRQATLEAVTDGLTGLANRRHFDRLLSRQVADAAERSAPLCLIMCDIDHFKRINDSWGHPVGDQVIRYVASAIQAAAPKPACGARYGGEEFALLLPRTNLDAAETIAQELLRRVRARTLSRKSSGELIGHITISAGVALLRPGERAEALLRRADAALYEAKRAGRDRVICEGENRAAA